MAYIHLSLVLLVAILSLAASLTFLITHPEDQDNALRLFYICWVAISGAVLWLVASILFIKLGQTCSNWHVTRSERGTHSNHIGDPTNTSEQRLFANGRSVPKISGPVAGSFIHFQAEPSSSIPSIISSAPLTPETPTPKPQGSSRFSSNVHFSPDLPQLPSIFSPFQFHPPDDEALYPQHRHPSRSGSLIALSSPNNTTARTPPRTFDLPLPSYTAFSATVQPPCTPSPVSACSPLASATKDPFTVSPLLGSSSSSPTKVTTSPLSQRFPVSDSFIPEITGTSWCPSGDNVEGVGKSLSEAE